MSKIDDYKRLKAKADRLSRLAKLSAGDQQCDKFGASVRITDAHYGFYGNSSCRSWSDEEVEAACVAIRSHWTFLLNAAAKTAASDAEQARRAAEEEAREVLALVSETV